MNKQDYIPKEQRKKILFLSDDIRMHSGVATMAREIVIGTAHRFNWVNIAGAINHPDKGNIYDLSEDTNKIININDSSIKLYPVDGYGNPDVLRNVINIENPDAIMFFTDPRYWIWLFNMEHELRQKLPMIYLNIWDDLPYPMYNKEYYESCDALFAISKQTENINRVVLKELSSEKIIKYIPHGINENHFFPIQNFHPEYLALNEFKEKLFNKKSYDFVLLFNSRNIRRKNIPDLLISWKMFIDSLDEIDAKKCALVLHTQIVDESGTDLSAVCQMIFGYYSKYNIIFSESKLSTPLMNLLYNSVDGVVLPSSNEGWGLSLTEGMMCGKPIIATVTGGIQDQMRFEDENKNWISFNKEFGSNHKGKYKNCGKWSFPVFPSNISLIGSVPTPYIFDDKISVEDLSKEIYNLYNIKINNKDYYNEISQAAREWVTSDESGMSAKNMCNNIIQGIEETIYKFTPRHKFEFITIDENLPPKHYV